MYSTELWSNIDHAFKIMTNLVAFHERSLLRNIVFNTIRCMSDEVNNHITFEDRLSDTHYLARLLGVWAMTWFFQAVITRNFFLKRPTLYACLQVFYVVGFGV
jgi:hypothetical protein